MVHALGQIGPGCKLQRAGSAGGGKLQTARGFSAWNLTVSRLKRVIDHGNKPHVEKGP